MPQTLVPAIAIVCAITIVLTTFTLLLRFYTRIFIQRRVRADDYLIIFSYITFLIPTSLVLAQLNHGVGTHVIYLIEQLPELRKALKLVFIAQIFYIVSTLSVKIVVTMFFCSLNPPWVLRYTAIITSVVSTMCGTGMALYVIFQCKPVSYYWQRINIEKHVPGKCLKLHRQYVLMSVFNASDLATDVVLAVLPFLMVWNMKKLSKSKKLAVAILLGLGVLTAVCPVIRCFYLKKIAFDFVDTTYDTAPAIITTIAEPAMAISICCIVQLRPLVRKLFPTSALAVAETEPHSENRIPTIGHARQPQKRRSFGMSILQTTLDAEDSPPSPITSHSKRSLESTAKLEDGRITHEMAKSMTGTVERL